MLSSPMVSSKTETGSQNGSYNLRHLRCLAGIYVQAKGGQVFIVQAYGHVHTLSQCWSPHEARAAARLQA